MASRKKFGFSNTENQFKTSQAQPSIPAQAENTSPEASGSAVQNLLKKIDEPVKKYAFDIKPVKRSKMVFSEDNDYPMDDIEKLASQILELGLIHNIEVYYDEDSDRYIVNAGERRTRAIDLLINRFKDSTDTDSLEYKLYEKHIKPFETTGYPCKVVYPEQEREIYSDVSDSDYEKISKLKKHIRMTVSNEAGREQDPARRRRKIESLSEDYSQLNAILNKDERINVNKKISEELKISDRQVKKYKAISKLIPELQKKFDENNISLNDGANYAQLTEDEQRQILALIEAGEKKEDIEVLYQKIKSISTDLANKENELLKVTSEKELADKKLQEEQKNISSIEQKIRSELTEKNEQELTILKTELEDAKKKLQISTKHFQEKEKEQQKVISELSQKKEQAAQPQNTDLMKLSWKIENSLTSLHTLLAETYGLLDAYSKAYTNSSSEKSPEVFSKELSTLLTRKK